MKALLLLCALATAAAAQPAEVVVSVPGPAVLVLVPAAPAAPPPPALGEPPLAPPGAWPARAPRQAHAAQVSARPRAALGVSPVGWLMRTYGASAWLALGERSALRFDGTVFAWDDSYQSYEAELTLPLYFVRALQGPFVEPGLSLRRTRGTPFVSNLQVDELEAPRGRWRHLRGPTVLVGWHWRLGERAHVAAAFGFAVLGASGGPADERVSTPNGYLRVGRTF